LDEPVERVNQEFKSFMLDSAKENARKKDDDGNPVFSYYFIYYSGHGKMHKSATAGIDYDNAIVPIEDYLFKVAAYKNTTVIGFFDCCRD